MNGPSEQLYGRRAERAGWSAVLRRPEPQAVLVVGEAGMGKSMLLREMAAWARAEPELGCHMAVLTVTGADTVGDICGMLLDRLDPDNARERAAKSEWFDLARLTRQAWAEAHENSTADPGEALARLLACISRRLPESARVIIAIDPVRGSRGPLQAWSQLIARLPDRVKLVFALRPDAAPQPGNSGLAVRLTRLPPGSLGGFDDEVVGEIAHEFAASSACTEDILRGRLVRCQGHPFAIFATLGLMAAGGQDSLAPDAGPAALARAQWRRARASTQRQPAVALFQALATLEMAAPIALVEKVAGIAPATLRRLLADGFLRSLVVERDACLAIRHSLLADEILSALDAADLAAFHQRAAIAMREALDAARMHRDGTDSIGFFAAERLSHHRLASGEPDAVVNDLVKGHLQVLEYWCRHDLIRVLFDRACSKFEPGSRAMCLLRLAQGEYKRRQGDLDEALALWVGVLDVSLREGYATEVLRCCYLLLTYPETLEALGGSGMPLHEAVLAVRERRAGGDPAQLAKALGKIADAYRQMGDFAHAADLQEAVASVR